MNQILDNMQKRKHRGGRPRAGISRPVVISTRVTEEEKDLILRKLADSGLSKSEALRLLIINDKLPKTIERGVSIQATDAYQKLQPLQSNLNQIAKALNSDRTSKLDAKHVNTIAQYVKFVEQEVKRLRQHVIDARGLT